MVFVMPSEGIQRFESAAPAKVLTLIWTKMELPEAIQSVLKILDQFDLTQQNQILRSTREHLIVSREEQLKKLDEQAEAIKDALSNL